jgi:hypothetical protein
VFTLKNLLRAALAATVLLCASEAEARFGKRSNSSDSEKKDKKEKKQDDEERQEPRSSGRVHDASAVDSSSRTHDASGVGSRPPPPPPPPPAPRPDTVIVVEQPPPTYYVEPPAAYAAPAPEVTLVPRPDTVYYFMRLALGGGPLGGGAGMDLLLAFEGEQLGLDGRVTGLSLPTDDGSEGSDGITLASAHLTYALVAQDRARWRLEAGFTTARAPDISFVGPSLATSLDARLVSKLDLESRVQLTPFPYRQLDAQLGLAYKPYPWAIRAGWRALVLDDAGRVDGVVHRDFFNGPYISFGLFL